MLFCFALFPIQGLCQFGSRSPSRRQNMSHKTEHWEDLETWLSVATDNLLPKAAETLKHRTQDQLDDNITSPHGTRPKSKLESQRISQDHRLLKSHTHLHPKVERQARCTTPAGADTRTTTHHAARTGSSGKTGRD